MTIMASSSAINESRTTESEFLQEVQDAMTILNKNTNRLKINEARSRGLKAYHANHPEVREKYSRLMTLRNKDPEFKTTMVRRVYNNPAVRKKLSDAMKKYCSDKRKQKL